MFSSRVLRSTVRLSAVCAFLAGSVLASGAALAAPLMTSSFGFGGSFTPEAGTNLGNNHQINIANSGMIVISSPDLFDLAGVVNFGNIGTLTSINDISAFAPINNFLVLASGVTYDLSSLQIISRTGTTLGGSFLNLYGLGILHAPGFSPTAASLSFSGTSSNNVLFTFAATINDPPAPPPQRNVPEPFSLLLLGSGFVGLGLLRKTGTMPKLV